VENAQNEAVAESAAPETQSGQDTLLAGKFKSREDLISSTAELVKQVEGRDMSPTEVLELSKQDDDALSNSYKGLERRFHTDRPAKAENDGELAEAENLLDEWARKRGFVLKGELQAQEYEEKELTTYFAQRPDAKSREDLIRTLAQTEGFKDKSFAEVDSYITSQFKDEAGVKKSRPSKMGQTVIDPNKSLDDMSDDEFLDVISSGRDSSLRRSNG